MATDEQIEGAAGVAHREQSRRVLVPGDGRGRKADHVAREAVADTQLGGAALVGLLAALRPPAEDDEAAAYGGGVERLQEARVEAEEVLRRRLRDTNGVVGALAVRVGETEVEAGVARTAAMAPRKPGPTMARRTDFEVAAQRTTVATSVRATMSRRRSIGMDGGADWVVASLAARTRRRLADDMAVSVWSTSLASCSCI